MSYVGKVILIGNAAVGKTSLLAQYVDGIFREEYKQTLGANFLIKEIDLAQIIDDLKVNNPSLIKDIQEKGFKLYFWDIGGQTDKLFANEYYFVQSLGAMVIFNLTDKKSFEDIDFWITKMKELSGDVPFIIIGNKSDLTAKRTISKDVITKKVDEYGVRYYETSAKLNQNVNNAFFGLAIEILNNFTK